MVARRHSQNKTASNKYIQCLLAVSLPAEVDFDSRPCHVVHRSVANSQQSYLGAACPLAVPDGEADLALRATRLPGSSLWTSPSFPSTLTALPGNLCRAGVFERLRSLLPALPASTWVAFTSQSFSPFRFDLLAERINALFPEMAAGHIDNIRHVLAEMQGLIR